MAIRAIRTKRIYPYTRADLALDATALRIKDSSPAWNPASRRLVVDGYEGGALDLEAKLVLDLPELRSRALGGTTSPIAISIVARCPSTRWTKELKRIDLPASSDTPFEDTIAFDVAGEWIAKKLELCIATALVSERPVQGFLARKPWNILAEKRFDIVLEPTGREFPNEWVSFREKGLPHGLWHLRFSAQDVSIPPEDALNVQLNKDVVAFVRLLSTSSSRKPELRIARGITLRYIATAVTANLLQLILDSTEDPPEDPTDREGTCWPLLFGTAKKVFDQDWNEKDELSSFKKLREKLKDQPNEIETRVQAAAGLPRQLAGLLHF
ncbi:MAG: hypothetical protein ACJ71U_07790 [Terriglobales bacterium]